MAEPDYAAAFRTLATRHRKRSLFVMFTDVIDVPNDGLYLFKVNAERTAVPDKDQLATIKSDAFDNWYRGKKAAVTITRDLLKQ